MSRHSRTNFLASTLDTDYAGFMNGGMLTFANPSNTSGASKGFVINDGNIGSTGGDVILIGSDTVDNVGTISAPTGIVELGVGRQVTLQDSTVGQQIFVFGNGGKIVNRGTIEAAQINLQADDGNIFALAGNHSVLRATGTAVRGGHVWLVANRGNVWQDGAVQANNADGSGGTVDTDGTSVRIAGDPVVTAKQWNLTEGNLKIDGVTAPVLQSNLDRGTSINVQTTGYSDGIGNIEVASNLDWSGAASLTLGAYQSVLIDAGATIGNRGSGNLKLRADVQGNDYSGSIVNNGTVDWSHSQGNVGLFYDMNGTYSPGKLLANPSWTAPYDGSLLTQFTAYQLVNSAGDLNTVANNVFYDLPGNYALGRDIDLIGAQFSQIGDQFNPFIGQFDGEGHTISDLSLIATSDGTREPWVGLFTIIGRGGIVRDLNVQGDVAIEAEAAPFAGINGAEGILAGYNAGTIVGVTTSGAFHTRGYIDEGDFTVAGGLVYTNSATGTIRQSFATGAVSGGRMIGANGLPVGPQNFGLAAVNDGQIYGAYWNKETTGTTIGVGLGTPVFASSGLTSAQMSNPTSFSGWDFSVSGDWAMPEGDAHPVLRWQLEP